MAAIGPFVLAIDNGTSSTKALLVDAGGAVVASASAAVPLSTPAPGWVEQDAERIWASCGEAVAACLAQARVDGTTVAAIGISNQRESTVAWERASGRPLGPMLSWQDQRMAPVAQQLRTPQTAHDVRERAGLFLDPMFSALKARWLLDTYDADRSRSRNGEICIGTVDSWLVFKLTGEHIAEAGNASRTLLLGLTSRDWDPSLLELFSIPSQTLGRVVASNGPFPSVRGFAPLPDGVRVGGVLGDSHAALFAHAGWRPGIVKATYGTGSSIMALTSSGASSDSTALCRTIAWDLGDASYAVEGNISSSGATLTWLAGLLHITPGELAMLAGPTSDGVAIVPAFSGLGAPWWDDDARGLIRGLTFASSRPQLARAALESIAFQVEDVLAAVAAETGTVDCVRVDGGPTDNPVLMQLQADISGRAVERALDRDLSALGAAHLAGLTAGLWDQQGLESLPRSYDRFEPALGVDERVALVDRWHGSIGLARSGG